MKFLTNISKSLISAFLNEFFYFYKVQVSDTKLLGKKGTTVIQLEKAGSEAEYIIRNVYQGSIVYLEKKYNKINYLLESNNKSI